MSKQDLDNLTARTTASPTFADLMRKIEAGYTPTLNRANGDASQLGGVILSRGGRVFWR